MAWLPVLLLILLVVAGLWAMRVRGALLQLAGAALLLGAAGYALQGRPGLAGTANQARVRSEAISLTAARRAFFGTFSGTEHWLIMSEAMGRRGSTDKAVSVLRSAVREHPGDPQLWIGLGNALMDHARMMTPPAEFAYRRAAELAPGHPAPPFFFGLALARSGDRQAAMRLWQEVLANAPANASWRPLVEDALAAFTSRVPSPRRTPGSQDEPAISPR